MIERIRTALRHGERGLSLIELLVAMSVATIIIVAVGGFFVASSMAAHTDSTSERGIRNASNVMNVFTRYIHAATVLPQASGAPAPAIEYATGTDVVFYAYVNLTNGTATQPVQVEFTTNSAGNVVERLWNGVLNTTTGFYTFPSYTTVAPNSTTVIGGPIASPTSDGTNLFVYLDANNAVIASPATATYGTIRAIQVNLEAGSTTAGGAGNTHLQNTLFLFNVGYATGTASGAASS